MRTGFESFIVDSKASWDTPHSGADNGTILTVVQYLTIYKNNQN